MPPMPMDGASDVPPSDPAGAGPVPGDIENAPDTVPPTDGMANGGDGGIDPSMDDGQLDPSMTPPADAEGDPSMGGAPEGEMDDLTQRVVDTMKNLTDKDKEAISAYADSLRDSSESNAEEEIPNGGEAPMMESFIFSKRQLKKINETFMINKDEDDEESKKKELDKKKGEKLSSKSPFNSPKFK